MQRSLEGTEEQLGAASNRLNSTTNLNQVAVNLSSIERANTDADFATETQNLAKAAPLQQLQRCSRRLMQVG